MNWTTDTIEDLHGKRVFITGANSGIGLEAARQLAIKNAEVVLAVRDLQKGNRARLEIIREKPAAVVEVTELDLADLASVNKCVSGQLDTGKPIDLLINNAGIMLLKKRTLSTQGHELHWATNHLGHFQLTSGLLPLIEKTHSPRIVTVSSLVAKMKAADIYYQDLNFDGKYDKIKAYAQSKLANAMFATELNVKLKQRGSKIISVAAHPGYTATNLQQHMGLLGNIMNTLFAQNIPMGALPILMAATCEKLSGGEYIGPLKMGNFRGYPGINTLPDIAKDAVKRQALWNQTETILGNLFFKA